MSAHATQRLRRRADFLKVATGSKAPAAAFVLQALKRGEDGSARVGFTVTKKVGSAVERNRVRRRLREIVKRSTALLRPGYDYVVVGRRNALREPFDRMIETFDKAVRRVHAAAPDRDTRPGARRPRPGVKPEPHPDGQLTDANSLSETGSHRSRSCAKRPQ